jgi:sulfate adenylyltransferase subunit 1 (EFTu-like GTPase family)
MIVGLENLPGMSTDLRGAVCWMNPRPLQPARKYFLKHTPRRSRPSSRNRSRIDIHTFESDAGARRARDERHRRKVRHRLTPPSRSNLTV